MQQQLGAEARPQGLRQGRVTDAGGQGGTDLAGNGPQHGDYLDPLGFSWAPAQQVLRAPGWGLLWGESLGGGAPGGQFLLPLAGAGLGLQGGPGG